MKLTVDGTEMEQVTPFTSLGQMITESGRCDDKVEHRTGIATSAAFNSTGR